jgi:uncharacterized protein
MAYATHACEKGGDTVPPLMPDSALVTRLRSEIARLRRQEASRPLKVSIMGQTGVGKSSLINALFNTDLYTDAVQPATKDMERIVASVAGHELWFYDLPGLGEAGSVNASYIAQYREQILGSDVVLWAIHCDNRAVSYDIQSLKAILGPDSDERSRLASKIVFTLTKVDLLSPQPWIFSMRGEHGAYVPAPGTSDLLRRKEEYYQRNVIEPQGDSIVAQTYSDGHFDIDDPQFSYDNRTVTHHGFMSMRRLAGLKADMPQHGDLFDRLYDNYRIIPSSSRFRFNLDRLLVVVVNKLTVSAIDRFRNFVEANDERSRVPVKDMRSHCNIVVYDEPRRQRVFDLARLPI